MRAGPGTKRWLGDFSDPAALRRQRRHQERQADLAEATAAQQPQQRIEGPAVPMTVEAAPPVRSKVEWTSTGERQYYTQAEYKAAHRMVPYEQRAVAVPYTADPTGVGAKPPTGPCGSGRTRAPPGRA